MSERLRKELSKVSSRVEKFDAGQYLVRRYTGESTQFEKNHFYLISVDTSETARNMIETTTMNWNAGKKLFSSHLKCEYLGNLGNMIKINGRGYNPMTEEDGDDIYLNYWIDRNVVSIIEELG